MALAAAVVSALATAIAWSDAHVTYALPNSVGHDVPCGGVRAVFARCGIARFRSPRSARACLIAAATALVVSLAALALFEIGPSPDY